MQQLPCGCRRAGRRNCIEPNCPRESEVSRNDLYFCPIARERNLRRTGEPELCPVELPAASYTQIICTGRCAKHRKEMEDNLKREKRREQKERERRRELEREREREREEKEKGRNGEMGLGLGLGLIREEGVVEDGDGNGNGNGMDANERMHVWAVLDARERARTEDLKVEQQTLREVDESGGLGWVDEGLKRMTLDEEREKRVVEERGVVEEKGEDEKGKEEENEKEKEEEQIVKWYPDYRTNEDRAKVWREREKQERMEKARKMYTGINALGKAKAATATLEEMVAKDGWKEDVRDGNEGMAETRRVSGALRRHGNETNTDMSSMVVNPRSVSGSSMPRPAGGEARRTSGQLRRHGNKTDSSAMANPSRSVSGNSVSRPQAARPAGGAYQDVENEFTRRLDEAGDDLYDLE